MDVAELLRELEEELVSPSVRRDEHRLRELLAEDFREFGASGRVYSRAEIIEALAVEALSDISIEDFAAWEISGGVALVTYRAVKRRAGEIVASMRSSLWVLRDGRWRMVFHQGTGMGSLEK